MKLRAAQGVVMLVCAHAVFAQSLGRYQTCQLQTVQGQAVPGAQVYFLTQPANLVKLTPQAQVYGSASGSTVAQPLLTNGFGECAAYLAPGVYTVVYVSGVTGTLVYPDQNVAVGGGTPTAPAFSAITSGSNSSAAMVVGSGASLTPSGSGVVGATMIDGVAVTGTPLTGQAIVATSPTAASWQAVSSSGSTTPAQQYDIPYYSASGTASTLAGTAVNGIVKGRSNGSPVAASSIDVANVLQGAANCTVAGEVYVPQSNTCVSASGLAVPGASGDLLYNNAGVAGASAATTDAAGNLSANSLGIAGGANLNAVQISNSLLNPLVVASGGTTGYQQGLALVDGSGDGLFLANDITHNQSQLGSMKSLNIIADDFTGNGPHSVSISNGTIQAASFTQEGGVGTTRLNKVYLQLNPSANCFSTDASGTLDTGCNPSQLEGATWESPPVLGYGSTTARPIHATTGSFIGASFSPTSTSGNSILVNSASTGSNAFTVPVYVHGAGGASDYNAAYVVDNGNLATNGGMGFPGPSSQPLVSNNLNLFSGTGITMQLDNGIAQGTGCFHVADGTNNWNLFSVCGNGSTNPALSTTTIPGTLNGFQGAFSNLTSGNCVQASTGGLLTTTGSPCGSGGSTAFSGLTAGTNTSAAMVVGSGASLAASGSGTINATTLLGKTWAAPGTIGGTTPGDATFSNVTAANTMTISTLTAGRLVGVGAFGLLTNSSPLAGAGPAIVTGPSGATNGNCVMFTGAAGQIADAGAPCGTGGSTSFSGITGGTNTTSAMVLGSGSSLTFSGSGANNASTLLGQSWNSPGAIGSTTPNTGAFTGVNVSGASSMQFVQFNGSSVYASIGNATSGANSNSQGVSLEASFWNGTVAFPDTWTIQSLMGAGTNPTTTLSISHGPTGTTGAARVGMPALLLGNITGLTQCVQADTNGNLSGTGSACVANLADTAITVGTTAIAANSCDAGHTVTMTGVTTAMTFSVTAAADVSAVTGWGPGTPGLYIQPWPTSNTFNYKVCNSSSSSITPGASVTFNVSAR